MISHQEEYNQLEHHYQNTQNEIVVLYGNRQSGQNDLLLTFLKNKPYFYYHARSCSAKLQLQLFYDEIKEELPKGMHFNARYPDIFSAMLSVACKKRLIVIDEFQNMLRSDPSLMDELIRIIHNKWNNQNVMFLLCTTAADWVGREMLPLMQNNAYEISSVIALSDATFKDYRATFPKDDFVTSVMGYSIFGPYPDNWRMLDSELTLSENICSHVLKRGSYFYERGLHILPDSLREPVVYHTILHALSEKKKLNDLHKQTGYERAKISVYMKNLIECGIVEKIESFDAPGHENTQKGLYHIVDPYLRFYFHYIFPHISKLETMEPEKFYRKYIEGTLRSYAAPTYVAVCEEYLQFLLSNGELDRTFTDFSSWYGKVGVIDIVSANEDGQTLAGYCNFEKNKMSYADYEWNNYCMTQAKLKHDVLYLFSQSSFDEKIKKETLSDPSIVLIEGDWD